ncbi:MAG TPA: CoA transferase [Burkholderiales bacterium]|nr:CoA transferase [Burkholderiales bacterium]
MSAHSGPLAGIRVIDLTQMLLGPYATQVLADFGADVVKVEPPSGDGRRSIGPARHAGMTSQFLHNNRGKRSIVVDLKQPQGRDVVLRLCAGADVLVHNSRREAMAKLGLAYGDVAAVKPDIVYCAAVGFGAAGPYAGKPAYDDMIQGLAAVPALNERLTGTPYYAPFNLSDRICGMVFVQTILATLVARARTGHGQSIELPMFETMAEFVLSEHMWGHTFVPPLGGMGANRVFERKPSPTRDGHLCFWIGTDAQSTRFLDALGLRDMKSDARFAARAQRNRNLPAFYERVNAVLATKSTAEWMAIFERYDVPAMPLNSLEDLMRDPHLEAVGFFRRVSHPSEGEIVETALPARWSRTQPSAPAAAPRLGEHTRELLREAGLDSNEIDALTRAGVIIDAVSAGETT